MLFKGACHCGAMEVELTTDRQPSEQVLGSCQCSFCRKHNARTFSDPKAHVTLTAIDPQQLQCYAFGLKTSDQAAPVSHFRRLRKVVADLTPSSGFFICREPLELASVLVGRTERTS